MGSSEKSVGFKVRGLVSDGATPNRKFYRMHLHFEKDNQKDGVTYWTWNRYAPNRNLVVSNEIVMSSNNKFIQNSSKNEDYWFLYL